MWGWRGLKGGVRVSPLGVLSVRSPQTLRWKFPKRTHTSGVEGRGRGQTCDSLALLWSGSCMSPRPASWKLSGQHVVLWPVV